MKPWASLVAQTVKCLPAMQETQVRSLGQEDPGNGNTLQYSCLENPLGLLEEMLGSSLRFLFRYYITILENDYASPNKARMKSISQNPVFTVYL